MSMMSNRSLSVTTPLPPDKLLVRSATVTEQLGQPFEMQIELLSRDEGLDFDALLGQDICLSLKLANGNTRYFHGLVAGLSQCGRLGNYACYRARAVPWLWFLTRTTDCCIFQKKDAPQNCSVPDILKKVFADHGFTDVKYGLTRPYRARDYCVQYCESDFNFVQRLMEEEGIYYYFTHARDKHTLVLADAYGCHTVFPGYATVDYFPPSENVVRDVDHICDWALSRNIQSGKYVTTDYDFTKPRTQLQTQYVMARSVPRADYEVFEYPGKYQTRSEGDFYSRARLERMQAGYETVRGAGNVRGMAVGSLFTLKRYPRRDQNREYLVVSATHRMDAGGYESGSPAEDTYSCSFEAIDAKEPFRPRATAFKTRVTGPQTAQVVGPAGEEIFTDKYARVKVKFHWDRDPARDENSSCWVRVSQVWAGKGWGSVSIPRIGQEVVVDFLEGDPDQPLIVGRVYNQDNMPPYDLPGAGVVSGVKSRTHKGDGFNEMSMDDTAGKEKVTIHAQYDMSTTVQHDQTLEVKNNRTGHVVVNDTLNVDADRTMHVKGKLSETIDTGREVTVSSGDTQTISGGATSTVNGGVTSTVNGGQVSTINDKWENTVNGPLTETVSGAIKQTGSQTIDIHATGAGTYTSDASLKFAVGGSVIEVTPGGITLSMGASVVKIDPAGVAVNGIKISLNG
jgi:type VI secretion system secreted protein VgrG